ncbi:peptidoglycan D,D-transpeptidase FtsI family protein [Paenibacillus methanolicus]|uniref:Penicillin-binding protein 2 n=1 Tax=Paenibacillus methanolicus TaxID=582686 RepID=A0A5S5BYE8_9BACL|nr:penicillin-binding protein 2 [Paenibacillus methanolicus]
MQDDPKKREISIRRHFSFRLNLFFFVTFFVFSVLIVRLAILQFVEGPQLKEEEASRGSKDVLIPPIRGNIYDSSGKAIAYSTSTQSLYYTIEPGSKEDDSKALAARLHGVFQKYGDSKQALTLDKIIKNMDLEYRKNTISVPRRIKSGLTNKEIAYFMEHRDLYKGIEIVEESIRYYDDDTVSVQLVGYLKKFENGADQTKTYKGRDDNEDPLMRYLGQEDVGFDGLEMMYQDVLRGKNGLKTYPINSGGRIIGPPVVTKPEKGDSLYLTINREVQLATEQAILDQIDYLQHTSDSSKRQPMARSGYAVAMEVNTGKVIAMASMPDYDPNVWEGGRISPDDYDAIQGISLNGTIRQIPGPYKDDKEVSKLPSSLVPLGSTQKPLTVLIGLNEKLFTTSTTWNDNGSFYYGKEGVHRVRIGNAKGHAYGLLDPAKAIAKSSNPWMAKMVGNELYIRHGDEGVDIWDKYEKMFGLGVLTESGLPGESAGFINYYEEMKAGSSQSALVQASFGQQGRYTTLQLAQYTSMLANKGKRMKPQFVSMIKDAEGNVVQTFKPEVLNTVDFPEAYWNELKRGMSQVNVAVLNGAAYTVERKTGTSQQVVGGKTIDNSVFIAYAPANNPRIAVAVVMPYGGFGADAAAPVARKILDAYDYEIGMNGVPKKPKTSANANANQADGTDNGTNAANSGAANE